MASRAINASLAIGSPSPVQAFECNFCRIFLCTNWCDKCPSGRLQLFLLLVCGHILGNLGIAIVSKQHQLNTRNDYLILYAILLNSSAENTCNDFFTCNNFNISTVLYSQIYSHYWMFFFRLIIDIKRRKPRVNIEKSFQHFT